MSAILTLTARQLAGSRRKWLVLALVSLPVLAGVLFHVADSTTPSGEFADGITATLIASGHPAARHAAVRHVGVRQRARRPDARLPACSSRSPRWRIAVPKVLASLLVGGVPVAVERPRRRGHHRERRRRGEPPRPGSGSWSEPLAYAAIFTWAGLATRHALIFGLVYVFIWEAVLAAYLDGIRFLSVRQFTLAVIGGLDSERLDTLDLSLGASAGAIGAAIVIGRVLGAHGAEAHPHRRAVGRGPPRLNHQRRRRRPLRHPAMGG